MITLTFDIIFFQLSLYVGVRGVAPIRYSEILVSGQGIHRLKRIRWILLESIRTNLVPREKERYSLMFVLKFMILLNITNRGFTPRKKF